MLLGYFDILFGKKMPIQFCLFLNQIVCFLLLTSMSPLYILDINPLSDIRFAKFFSHFVGCLFILLIISFAAYKLLSLMQSHLLIFALLFVLLVSYQKLIAIQMLRSFLPMFSSRSFMVSGLTFKTLINFELIFVSGMRQGSNFIVLHVFIHFFPISLVEEPIPSSFSVVGSLVEYQLKLIAFQVGFSWSMDTR